MLFNHSIQFLDNAYKDYLLASESKLVFRGKAKSGPETHSRPAEKKENEKNAAEKKHEGMSKLREELKEGKQYQKSFETFIGNHEYSKTYNQKLTKTKEIKDLGIDITEMISKRTTKKVRKTKNFNLIHTLSFERYYCCNPK